MTRLISILILLLFSATSALADLEGPGSGLVGWWKFNEGTGSIVHDSSGSGNNGIIIGSPTWTTGPFGTALSFNGTTDYIRIPYNRSLKLGLRTIAVWANLGDFLKLSGSVYGWGRGGCQDNYRGWVNSNGSFRASYQNSHGEIVVRPGTLRAPAGTAQLGEWAHYAFVYSTSGGTNITISLYKNGALQDTPYTAEDGLSSCGAMTAIGSQEDYPHPAAIRTFSGIMHDFRVYNRVLSGTEIIKLYKRALPVSSSDTAPPSTPINVTATAISASQVDLAWTASTDNVGVAGYVIYRGGSPIAAVRSGTTYSDTAHAPPTTYYYTLDPSTAYTYTVAAFDAAGNYSARSAPASATSHALVPSGPFTLSVTMLGSPLGIVMSAPAGIICKSGTCKYSYAGGTTVVLTPYPYIVGMWPGVKPYALYFSGWSGDGCSGIGECVIIINSNKAVTAHYNSSMK
jgi:hypothetical protein